MVEARQRAPQREGRRTTLRVPTPVFQAAQGLAAELGTTTNDALIRLAQEGVESRRRRAQIERLARERRAVVWLGDVPDSAEFPAPDELARAMRSGRAEP